MRQGRRAVPRTKTIRTIRRTFISVGKIFKFHNDLDTDQIIASQYLLLPTIDEMKDHTFESLDPDFPKKVKPGDYVVGGETSAADLPENRRQVY